MVSLYSHSKILVLAGGFLILEGYNSMAIKYNPGYERLVQLVQEGGPAALNAMKASRQDRKGYMSPVNISMIDKDEDDSDSSLEVRLYNRFKEVQDSNKFLNESNRGKLVQRTSFSKSSGVTVDKAMETSFKLIDDLKADYGMSTEVAAGFVGNLWHETGGFKYMQEIRPLVKGSKGGLGFAQWTGRRRNNFESYLEQQGKVDTASYDANYGFLKQELDTTESRVLKKLEGVSDITNATKIVSKNYLIPDEKYAKMDERIKAAKNILERYNENRSLTDEDN
tara:strand:+ start:1176 stop:2018 length:843 start_codon:yes stop_codon:yes gene_type:complete